MSLDRPARARAHAWATYVALGDLLPPRIRYGYLHRFSRALFSRPLPSVAPAVSIEAAPTTTLPATIAGSDTVVGLLADHLDIGGIGAVIEMLAIGLRGTGVRPIVIVPGDGARAARLRASGVPVTVATDAAATAAALEAAHADVVQLHSVPRFMEEAALACGLALVTVFHNTEIHFTRARWGQITELVDRSAAAIAVSETVRSFHVRRLPEHLAPRIHVVANGAPSRRRARAAERDASRAALAAAVGASLGDDIVVACLCRYDSQKNIAGTVASFLRAARQRDDLRLVIAGDPSDWAEWRRADAVRRTDPAGARVHLLGNSDAATLLSAADAFLLNSFFEGWPVAATEAAAAGLPLILSDMGGGAELVARDRGRSHLIGNPSGDADLVSDRRVVAARRRTLRQGNADDLAGAVLAVAAAHGRPRTEDPPRVDVADMVAAHTRHVRAARASAQPLER